MRLLLLSSFSSLACEDDALVLRARGYDAVTYYDLHTRQYKYNNGEAQHAYGAHLNLLLELVNEDAALAVHPSADPALVQEVAALCRLLGVKLLRMSDLPLTAPAAGDRRWKEPLHCLAALTAEQEERMGARRTALRPNGPEGCAPGTTDQLGAATAAPAKATHGLRERLVALYRRCSDALRAADAYIGDGLKNPMVREQRMRQKALDYGPAEAPLSTTG